MITARRLMSEDEAAALSGTHLSESSFDTLIDEDADLMTEDGEPLIIFRKRALQPADCRQAWRSLREAANGTDNRGVAAGALQVGVNEVLHDGELKRRIGARSRTRFNRVKQDGTVSKTSDAKMVRSGLVGYFDRNPRFPFCRMTAYSLAHPDRFRAAMPFIEGVNEVFKAEAPERWAAQQAIVERTHPDFIIKGTAFTTITVNCNWQTAVHKDAGDYRPGFGCMSVLEAGSYAGGYLVLPAYRLALNVRTRDVLLSDVHEWHGNTPITGHPPYERISCIFYYREKMAQCESAERERERAKRK